MSTKKRILLKITGEILASSDRNTVSAHYIQAIIKQIIALAPTHHFSIVIGGGNFFRGSCQGAALGMSQTAGHQAGMLATMINGVIIQDLFTANGLSCTLLSAITAPEVAQSISGATIHNALIHNSSIVFIGGTGNPFFTTDTCAIVRGLQINAHEIWKGTNVDGIYDADPAKNVHAKLLKNVTFDLALQQKLGIMDSTAYALAQQHNAMIKIFNIFTPDALMHAAHDKHFGSVIHT